MLGRDVNQGSHLIASAQLGVASDTTPPSADCPHQLRAISSEATASDSPTVSLGNQ